MKVSHLVVNGCSWTYCQGLPLDRLKIDSWPALVAEEFKIPVVNLAEPGSGNDGIHRRTYEYVFEDAINDNNPLYIIGWSQTWRREAWCRKMYRPNNQYDGYNIVSFPHGDKPTNSLEYSVLDTWSEEDFYRKTLLYRLSLDSLFKSKKITYFSSFFAPEEFNNGKNDSQHIISSYKDRFKNTMDYVKQNTNQLTSFALFANEFPKTECGHYGVEGNKAIADYIIKELKLRLNYIECSNEKYLSLKDYLKKTDLNDPSSEWI